MKSKINNHNRVAISIKLLMALPVLICSGLYTQAQNGLDSVIVEKYYVSSAADTVGQHLYGTIPIGSVTYRIYVDMKPGYKFQALYGVTGHELRFKTSTSFFNNEDRGKKVPDAISVTNTMKNTVMIDTWVSVGAAASGKSAVLKTEDTDGSIGNSSGLLQNSDPSAGIPIKTQDGMIAGAPDGVTFVGITTELDIFDATSQLGNLFTTSNGSIACLTGAVGPTATNRVLLGQFTTDGNFSFRLNFQLGTPTGGVENYVAVNPVGSEVTVPGLIYPAPVSPTVTITSPFNGAPFTTGTIVPVSASAGDADGTVDTVRFFVDGLLHSFDLTAPYEANWTSTVGSHTLTAVAVDNDLRATTSSPVIVNVTNNVFPTCSISSPSTSASYTVGNTVTVAVSASDPDGTIDSVDFFVDGVKIGYDVVAPYSINWLSTAGSKTITAVATDDLGGKGASVPVVIFVNAFPSCNLVSPINTSIFTTGDIVPMNALATDPGGSIVMVDFFIENAFAHRDSTFPYEYNWTSTVGTKKLKATATDNLGAQSTSSTSTITVVNNATPTVSITFPASGTQFTAGDTVTIFANAGDADGSIAYVQFYAKGQYIGNDADSLPPYTIKWKSTAASPAYLSVIAVDNKGAMKASAQVSITVKNNVAPTVSIQYPTNGSIKIGPGPLVIQANAADADGYVDSVMFYVDGNPIGTSVGPLFQATYMMTTAGKDTLTAVAVDNHGMMKTSSNVIITVKDTTSGVGDLYSSASLFNIFPNPAKDHITMEIVFDDNRIRGNGSNRYVLYNIEGKECFGKELGAITKKQVENIDLSGIENGEYFMVLFIDEFYSVKKIVKQ